MATKFQVFSFILAVVFAIHTTPVLCENFTIVTSATSPCPGELWGEVCLTLDQYASNPSHSSEIVLVFQSGEHMLTTNLVFSSSGTSSFSITTPSPGDKATVNCNAINTVTVALTGVRSIHVSGISFIGCGTAFSIDGSVTVELSNVVFDDRTIKPSYRTSFSITQADQVQNPTSRVVLRNVEFESTAYTEIKWMETIILQGVTFNGSGTFTATSRDTNANAILNITDSVFTYNSQPLSMSFYKLITIRNSSFTGNQGTSIASDTNTVVENSFFANNHLGFSSHHGNLSVINCTFTGNGAERPSKYDEGGAIKQLGINLTLKNCAFEKNIAGYGGAVSAETLFFKADNCTFVSNVAFFAGGAMQMTPYRYFTRWFNSTYYATSNIIYRNNSAANGGAVYLHNIYNNLFYSNTLSSTHDLYDDNEASGFGGAIYADTVRTTNIMVRQAVFQNNRAVGATSRGGVVFSQGWDVSLSLVENMFDNNSATSCGVVDATDHTLVALESSSFTNSTATGQSIGGGVLCIRSSIVSINNSTFTYSRANLHGGVLYVDNSFVAISNSTFLRNYAAAKGGIMYTQFQPTTYWVSHSAFSYNEAGLIGGLAYFNKKGTQFTMTRSIISFNSASARGGAFSVFTSELNITESNIYNNTADVAGDISACDSVVHVQGLTPTVDSSNPSCSIYDGDVLDFDIVPPHNYSTLISTTSSTSEHSTTSSTTHETTSTAYTPMLSSYLSPSTTSPMPSLPSEGPTHSSLPFMSAEPTSTISPTDDKNEDDRDKRQTTIIYALVAVIAALIMCVIALATKVVFDCVRRNTRQIQHLQNFPLQTESVLYTPLANSGDTNSLDGYSESKTDEQK